MKEFLSITAMLTILVTMVAVEVSPKKAVKRPRKEVKERIINRAPDSGFYVDKNNCLKLVGKKTKHPRIWKEKDGICSK